MNTSLVRFGLAVDSDLLEQFDALVERRGCTRSELFRDLARAEVSREHADHGGPAVATLTLVYDHHVRELTEKLTALQHELGDAVRCALHLHLSHSECLEVIVMSGRGDQLKSIADRISATRGVKHGRVEIIAHAYGAPANKPNPKPHKHDTAPQRTAVVRNGSPQRTASARSPRVARPKRARAK
jgi:CopG family nickel-responsive transcriptional regulator